MADKSGAISKKRNRIPVSCESCRIRKLKCDRQKPCLNCTSRNLECTFANGVTPRTKNVGGSLQGEDLRSKLHRLEAIVNMMAENSSQAQSGSQPSFPTQQKTPQTDTSESPPSSPDMESQNSRLYEAVNGHHYIGGSHWETVIQEIASIREQYEEEIPYSIQDKEPYLISRNPALLAGTGMESISALVEGLPSRSLADRLISRFFDTYDPAIPSRPFDNFWSVKETGRFCPASLGSYFAVFALAMLSYDRQDDPPTDLRGRTGEFSDIYRKRSAQCLLRADITAPTRASVECLLLQTICEYARSSDGFLGQWMLLGILVRKALHMGLHRDPSEFPSLSPFESEMRRRLWAYIWQFDMLFAFQLGLPISIQPRRTNVAAPLNVFEEELSEDMKELPPSRPIEEITDIGFVIAKLNVLRALSAVVEQLNSLQHCSMDDVDILNKKLQDAYDLIPQHLRIRPFEESVAASKTLRLRRLQLQMFYDKTACVLNRRFISKCSETFREARRPRQICVRAALSMLSIQETYEQEQSKWWLFHFSKQDFLLAAAILFLVLFSNNRLRMSNFPGPTTAQELDEEDRLIHAALNKSQMAWERILDVSMDAKSATRMFRNMRSKLQHSSSPNAQPDTTYQMDVEPAPIAVKTEALLDTVTDTNFEQFGELGADIYDVDWSAWESTMQQPGLDNVENFWLS